MIIDETTDLTEAQRELECARAHVVALERDIKKELARRKESGSMAPVTVFQKPSEHEDPKRLMWKVESGDIYRSGT